MPCDYKQYPPNWKEIVARLKELRGDCCELCFAPNGAKVYRDNSPNIMHPWYPEFYNCDGNGWLTKIIITTHHIDSDKKNNSDDNLILLCQRCHLRLDRAKHKAKRRKA